MRSWISEPTSWRGIYVDRSAKPSDRIALLFDKNAYFFIAMLAVLTISAAYLPLEVAFPPDRMAYICDDAGATFLPRALHRRFITPSRVYPFHGFHHVVQDTIAARTNVTFFMACRWHLGRRALLARHRMPGLERSSLDRLEISVRPSARTRPT